MKGDFSKDTMEYKFMADYYAFCRDHYISDNTHDYWDKTLQDANELCAKYKDHEFVVSLVMGFLDYAERSMKNGKSETER